MSSARWDEPSPTLRNETPAERLDRNWGELLQELRISQPAVQVLTGFLLTIPFQQRFAELATWLVELYTAALVFGILATALMVAPVTLHRGLFARGLKARLVVVGDICTRIGIACFGVSTVLAAVVVFSFALQPGSGVWVGVALAVVFALLWLALPLAMRVRPGHRPPSTPERSQGDYR